MLQKLDARWGIFKFKHAAMGFLLGVFFFPSYFGINIGFDLTVLRMFEIILFVMIYKNKIRLNQFINLVKNCKQNIFILLYFFIVSYTNIYRGFAINGILYTFFNWVCVFYLMYYLIQYEWGLSKLVKYLKIIVFIVCLISLAQLIIGFSPFTLLETLPGKTSTNARFGMMRIMGNCGTPNGFGLYLTLLLPICTYDEINKQIDMIKNKWLLLLLVICVMLTGNRLSAGIVILEIVLLLFLSPKSLRRKTLLFGGFFIVVIFAISLFLQEISFFRSILLTFFSAVDEVFNTSFSVKYGADPQTLQHSTVYRDLMWRGVFIDTWLQPFLGQGVDYHFAMYIDGYLIQSIDNYYVGLFVAYAYPGLIAFCIMSGAFLVMIIKNIIKKINRICIVILVSFMGYYLSLWFLDQLGTFPIMMTLFAIACMKGKKEYILYE